MSDEQLGNGTADADGVTRARFRILGGQSGSGDPITVHFNPESLEYSVSNNIQRRGSGDSAKQFVSQSSGSLSMELVFDTTDTGMDVRQITERFHRMMRPAEDGADKVAQVVQFEWGTYHLTGVIEQYKETLDYFSAEGVPLRASASLTLAQQEGLFEPTSQAGEDEDGQGVKSREAFPQPGQSATDAAGGDPAAARELGLLNQLDNLRFLASRPLTLDLGRKLRGPLAFASQATGIPGLRLGGGGLGIGLGIGLGGGRGGDGRGAPAATARGGTPARAGSAAGGGVLPGSAAARPGSARTAGSDRAPGASATTRDDEVAAAQQAAALRAAEQEARSGALAARASAPTSTGASPITGPAFGGRASAGVTAAEGAFAGLGPPPPPRIVARARAAAAPGFADAAVRTDAGAEFAIGGRALERGPSGLRADVGARASLLQRVVFDKE
jgi:hypothetical protein